MDPLFAFIADEVGTFGLVFLEKGFQWIKVCLVDATGSLYFNGDFSTVQNKIDFQARFGSPKADFPLGRFIRSIRLMLTIKELAPVKSN